jgi:hypothetical protein
MSMRIGTSPGMPPCFSLPCVQASGGTADLHRFRTVTARLPYAHASDLRECWQPGRSLAPNGSGVTVVSFRRSGVVLVLKSCGRETTIKPGKSSATIGRNAAGNGRAIVIGPVFAGQPVLRAPESLRPRLKKTRTGGPHQPLWPLNISSGDDTVSCYAWCWCDVSPQMYDLTS